MKDMMNGNKITVLILFFLSGIIGCNFAQTGKIVFERKINLEKRFAFIEDDDQWLAEFLEQNKYKTEIFELYFNDTCSMFKFQDLEDEIDEDSWATYKNTVYQNFNSDRRVALVSMWGDEVVVNVDSMQVRKWQITDSKRMIGKYQCRKAIWQMNDSTKIYAWYSIDVLLPTGPEGFGGLPGTILGLATEDGGVVYFAKSVELTSQKPSVFELKTKKKKIFTREELRTRLKQEIGGSPQGELNISLMLDWL